MDDWITLARVVRPRGNRGEVLAEPLSGRPDAFSAPRQVLLSAGGHPPGEGRPVLLESAWWHRGRLVLKFAGIDSISDAEAMRGAAVCVPASARAELPAGEYYQDDLVGCDVVERSSGRSLGRVSEWRECGGPPLLVVVDGPEPELLVPFAASICVAIEPERRRIVVDLPEGLKEVNRR
jgi:16S rRNA processing protein RimM